MDGFDKVADVGFDRRPAGAGQGVRRHRFAFSKTLFDPDQPRGVQTTGVAGEVSVGHARDPSKLDKLLAIPLDQRRQNAKTSRMSDQRLGQRSHNPVIGHCPAGGLPTRGAADRVIEQQLPFDPLKRDGGGMAGIALIAVDPLNQVHKRIGIPPVLRDP